MEKAQYALAKSRTCRAFCAIYPIEKVCHDSFCTKVIALAEYLEYNKYHINIENKLHNDVQRINSINTRETGYVSKHIFIGFNQAVSQAISYK